jgi:hypothetical protein
LRVSAFVIALLFLPLFIGCASSPVSYDGAGIYTIKDISKGLPVSGLWRENVVIIDMDGDGQLDIVAPPPRKAAKGDGRPYVFARDKEGVWKEKKYTVSGEKEYGYGGIAVGDLNGDRYPDIVLAEHSGAITLFMNDGHGGFTVSPFPTAGSFYSREVKLSDLNGDGRPDIVALSEASFVQGYKPRGILTGINRDGTGWDVKVFGEDSNILGDSLSVGDIRGKGRDIAIANMTTEVSKKLLWFGDGKGMFEVYDVDFVGRAMPYMVGLADVDGDGRDEVIFRLAGIGRGSTVYAGAFKWTGDAFKDISSGLEKEVPIAFDFADIDGDGKKEMALLSESGMHIYKYKDSGWVEQAKYDIPAAYVRGARSLNIGKNNDGLWMIVFNMGFEAPELQRGIKAFLVKKR